MPQYTSPLFFLENALAELQNWRVGLIPGQERIANAGKLPGNCKRVEPVEY